MEEAKEQAELLLKETKEVADRAEAELGVPPESSATTAAVPERLPPLPTGRATAEKAAAEKAEAEKQAATRAALQQAALARKARQQPAAPAPQPQPQPEPEPEPQLEPEPQPEAEPQAEPARSAPLPPGLSAATAAAAAPAPDASPAPRERQSTEAALGDIDDLMGEVTNGLAEAELAEANHPRYRQPTEAALGEIDEMIGGLTAGLSDGGAIEPRLQQVTPAPTHTCSPTYVLVASSPRQPTAPQPLTGVGPACLCAGDSEHRVGVSVPSALAAPAPGAAGQHATLAPAAAPARAASPDAPAHRLQPAGAGGGRAAGLALLAGPQRDGAPPLAPGDGGAQRLDGRGHADLNSLRAPADGALAQHAGGSAPGRHGLWAHHGDNRQRAQR